MQESFDEKVDAALLLPSSYTPTSNRNSFRRKIALSVCVIVYGIYIWFVSKGTVVDIFDLGDFTQPQCIQSADLTPVRNEALWALLSSTIGTEAFEAKAVEWISGAVRVPTESYDDMGDVGEDPRWEAFVPFHDYLLKSFPLVHSTLTLQKVNTYGLIYTWEGSNTSLKPLVLMGHQDVVPVNPETIDEWTHPPYSGHFDGSRVWGRGSSDDKSGLIGALASVETLIKSGFKPTRTLVLSFGFDEEISGRQGASKLAQALYEIYGKDGVALLVDEGGGFTEQNGTIMATPGIAEKGYLDVRVEVTMPGGHSSVPPKHTSIGILSAFLVEYEKNPSKVKFTRQDPLYSMLQCVAEHSEELDEDYRTIIKRATTSDKYLQLLEKEIIKNNVYASLIGTTQAADIIEGGVKVNALPERAFAVVNHRISVISSVEEVQTHDTELLSRLVKEFNLTYTAFGNELSAKGGPSSGTLTLKDAFGTALEPAPVTPTSPDAVPWYILSGTIKATYNSHRSLTDVNEIIVSPGMPSGNTDTRYYWDLTKHIFRYNHHNSGKKTNILSGGVHTVNEHIETDAFVEIVRFFVVLILNADEATNL
ncbi:Carboxypeptidase S [Termitomyces sp. T112]|nr:Carboxypeptidase S [Termitomyces sp. T112]